MLPTFGKTEPYRSIWSKGLNFAGAPEGTNYAHDRQKTLNGACFAYLVDRIWITTQNETFLKEYYPALKANARFTFGTGGTADRVLGVISAVSDDWYESMDMRGITAHAGGVRLASFRFFSALRDTWATRHSSRSARTGLRRVGGHLFGWISGEERLVYKKLNSAGG